MSSTFVADTTDDSSSSGNTVIIIVNEDTGNISVDQETLQLLTSQENTTLSVVRVNDTEGDSSADVNMTVEEIYNPVASSLLKGNQQELMETDQEVARVNGNAKVGANKTEPVLEPTDPLMDLDQEEILKIEHALQAEAGQFFTNNLPLEAGLDDILDPELTGEPDESEAVATITLDHSYSAALGGTTAGNARNADSAMSSEIDSSDSVSTGRGGGGSRRQPSPKRRSQRQIDKQEMEQLKKIRAENEELLKKEKEEILNQIQQVSPAKKETEAEPLQETLFVPVEENFSPEPTPPAQQLSRLTVIRQELQQKIQIVEPVKAKVQTPSPHQTVKSPLSRTQPLAKTPQSVPAKTPPHSKQAAEVVKSPVQAKTVAKTPQSPQKQSDAGRQSPVSRVTSSGGVARPRRENRQPPKHLREAFTQIEFEGIERLVKKTSVRGVSSPEPVKSPDTSFSEEKPVDAVVSSPKKMDESKDSIEEDDDFDDVLSGEESEEDEDDPDRLWCVCRAPHNNRFMICCDKCEDWFHGKCVGVTRSMGKELEVNGLDWICPRCVRQEHSETQGPFVHLKDIDTAETTIEEKSPTPVKSVEKAAPSSPDKLGKEKAKLKAQMTQRRVRMSSSGSATAEEPVVIARRCVVTGCKSDARPNSVYCSDACIVSHAREALNAMSKEKMKDAARLQQEQLSTPTTPTTPGASKWKESVEFGQLMSQPTPPLASKSKAISQLKKSNSTEYTKPANLADDTPVPVMEKTTGKVLTGSSAPKVGNLEQWLKENASFEVIRPNTLPKNKLVVTPTASTTKAASPATPTGQVPSPSSSLPRTKLSSSKKPGDTPTKTKVIRKRSMEMSKEEEASKKVDPETMRASAKSSLKDVLWNRCKEATDLTSMEESTVEQVAADVEEALYRLFNKDVGLKYKAKYRSLIFNIKDPKNLGLFRKIVEKQITPGQLVKMTGEELASKELAEWREREAKHSLDIIQKTELELMSMSTKYLVKTHKGEEIIEEAGKELDENESATSTTTIAPTPLLEALQDTTSKHSSHLFDLNCQICSGKIKEEEADKDKSSSTSSSTTSRNKKNDNKSSSSSNKKSSHHHHSESSKRSDRDRDRSKKSSHDKERSHHRSSRSKDRHHKHRSDRDKERDKRKEETKKEEKPLAEPVEVKPEIAKEDVVATSTNEALPASKESIPPALEVQPEKPKEEEPTSTVSIKTPEEQSSPQETVPVVWKGAINTESGKVNVQAMDLTGSSECDWDLPASIDVVGRIKPEMVWDYVNQNRKAGTRDIVVFKFNPASDGDRKTYGNFLSHMYKSNRFSVIGPVKAIKDFYVLPLPKDSPIPLALATLSSGTKSLDENRTTSLLLGVLVRSRKKRTGDQAGNGGPMPSKAAKVAKLSAKSTPPSTGSSGQSPSLNYIPTSRANSKKTKDQATDILSAAGRALTKTESDSSKADDAPYSPGQLLAEEEESMPPVDKGLLEHKAMLEDLNRQIEAEKQELAAMSAVVATSSTTSPEMMIPGLGEPVIPGLGEPSTSSTGGWVNSDTRVTPHTDPPFDHSAKAAPAASLNNLNISNLQEIISTIQKKELEMKMTSKPAEDRSLPVELFSPHDIDMRIAPPVVVPVVPKVLPAQVTAPPPPVEKKKPSLLNQLSDEQLLAKAMEMEMEQAGIPVAPINTVPPPPFFSPPRGAPIPYPPMGGGPGMPPGPMMGHPRPFHQPPPFMGPGAPYQHPPPGPNFRPRPGNKKKR